MNVDLALEEVYAGLPTIDCQGLCSASCGPIVMSQRERERAEASLGRLIHADDEFECSALVFARCRVYPVRPLICRLWGIVETMPCQWGCKPQPRYLTRQEGFDLIRRVRAIGGPDT